MNYVLTCCHSYCLLFKAVFITLSIYGLSLVLEYICAALLS